MITTRLTIIRYENTLPWLTIFPSIWFQNKKSWRSRQKNLFESGFSHNEKKVVLRYLDGVILNRWLIIAYCSPNNFVKLFLILFFIFFVDHSIYKSSYYLSTLFFLLKPWSSTCSFPWKSQSSIITPTLLSHLSLSWLPATGLGKNIGHLVTLANSSQ